jgi:hypothetical protein
MTTFENPTRRTALALACAPALGGLPALALPALAEAAAETAPDPDAGLHALIDFARECGRRAEAAEAEMLEAFERIVFPPPPVALLATGDDTRYWEIKVGEPIQRNGVDIMKRFRAFAVSIEAPHKHLDERIAVLETAHTQWQAAKAPASAAVDEAEERYQRILGAEEEALHRVADAPAHTPAGVMAKLALVGSREDIDEGARPLQFSSAPRATGAPFLPRS